MTEKKRTRFEGKRLFVLDTNVLMHDPTALFHFQEHDVYLPMAVIEELDNNKKGHSEVARNARQASRFLDELMIGVRKDEIDDGLPLTLNEYSNGGNIAPTGRLFFQTSNIEADLPATLPGSKPDNNILGTALALRSTNPNVTVVSKDTNMRIKAAVIGLHAEDYRNDQVLDDVNLLYSGTSELDADFWESHSKAMDSWQEEGRTYYRITGPDTAEWYSNGFLYLDVDDEGTGFESVVRKVEDGSAIIETVKDFRSHNSAWGINARNREQNFALNLLMDPEVDFVTLLGQAGTGKTLLALAAGLAQTLDQNIYQEIIMTRATVPVGEDIGFLPGTEEEKMAPWMGALMDNLEVLTQSEHNSDWERAATNELLNKRVKIRSMNFMRGRTFLQKYVIIDEAQNLTAKQMKTLITRAGPGTKVICLGNVAQIDTPYLTETNSGLTFVVDRFKGWEHGGHVTLARGERSRLADHAAEVL